MQVLVAITCMLAVASAGLIAPYGIALQSQHLPIIGPNGVPLEPAANVAARAQHAVAVAEAQARNGNLAHAAILAGPAAIALSHPAAAVAIPIAVQQPYHGPQHLPIIGPNGVPLEPAANVAARAQHSAAVAEAQIRNGDAAAIISSPLALATHGAAILAAPQHLPVIGPHGVPIEPLANQLARAQNAAAHLEAKVRNGHLALHGRKRRGLAYLAAAQHIPVIGPNGVPLEPPANVAARAAHAAAYAEAASRTGAAIYAPGAPIIAHINPAAHTYPAIGADGQPIETPEVQHLKAAHFSAHAETNARNAIIAANDIDAAYYAPGVPTIAHNVLTLLNGHYAH